MAGYPGFLGTRGTGDWATDERPKNWRETILYLYPNGGMPLTALLSKLSSEVTTDPQFYWWTKALPDQAATPTGVYLSTNLSTTYVASYPDGGAGAVAGVAVTFKMAAASAYEFRVGHVVLLRDESDYNVDCVAKVTAVVKNGASSYITVSLLEDDDNSYDILAASGHTLASCDKILIIGSVNEEGAPMPSAISYDPTKYYNYTQIFRTPLSITRTARLTKLRTGDAYKRMKREALEIHGLEMEKAFWFGIATENTGTGGKPERTTSGVISFLRENVATNCNDFRLNSSYSGKQWLDAGGGDDWLDAYLEQVFRYGAGEKLGVCGSSALLGLNKLARAGGHMTLTPMTTAWGIKVVEWVTPFGTMYLKMHPLFSFDSSLRNTLVILEPSNLKYRYITDTTFYGASDGGNGKTGTYGSMTDSAYYSTRVDGTDEEYLTECGLELHHPSTMMYLNGVGANNAV